MAFPRDCQNQHASCCSSRQASLQLENWSKTCHCRGSSRHNASHLLMTSKMGAKLQSSEFSSRQFEPQASSSCLHAIKKLTAQRLCRDLLASFKKPRCSCCLRTTLSLRLVQQSSVTDRSSEESLKVLDISTVPPSVPSFPERSTDGVAVGGHLLGHSD